MQQEGIHNQLVLEQLKLASDKLPVRLLVSASPNQPANSIFLSQQTSTSQPKSTQKPTSERTVKLLTFEAEPSEVFL